MVTHLKKYLFLLEKALAIHTSKIIMDLTLRLFPMFSKLNCHKAIHVENMVKCKNL